MYGATNGLDDHRPGEEAFELANASPAGARLIGALRRRWWIIILAVAASAALMWWKDRSRIDVYTAEVLIRSQAEDPLFSAGLRSDAALLDFGGELEIIRSRAVLVTVVDSLGLQFNLLEDEHLRSALVGRLVADRQPSGQAYLLEASDEGLVLRTAADLEIVARSESTEIAGPGFTLHVNDPSVLTKPIPFDIISQDVAIERLKGRIQVEPGKGAGLTRIRYTDPDPHFAAAVANSVAQSYRDYGIHAARQQARQRRDVILTQLVKLADSVRTAQEAMLAYQQSQQMINPDVEGNALLSARLQAETDLRSLRFQEGLLRSVSAGLQAENPDLGTLQALAVLGRDVVPAGAVLHQRLQQLQTDRSRLTASQFGLTEHDPRVQVVDSLIAGAWQEMRVAASQALNLGAARLADTESRLAQIERQIGELPQRAAGVNRLQQQVDRVQRVFDSMVSQYFEAEIAESVEGGNVQVVDPAVVPLSPNPSLDGLNMLIAVLAGLAVGGLGAAGMESIDRRVRNSRDAGRAARLFVVGTVPRFNSMKGDRAMSALIVRDSLRSVWANLGFIQHEVPHVLAITSPAPREGKTTVATNLALALADQGNRVLLIDADVRRPAIHRILDANRTPGLTELLGGRSTIEQAAQPVSPTLPNLWLLPSGGSTEDPAALFTGPDFARLLEIARSQYDLVLIDMPPVLAVVETLPIAKVAGLAVIVARADRTDTAALAEATDQLRVAGVSLAGLVTNAVPLRQTSYQRYTEYYTRNRHSDHEYERDLALWRVGDRNDGHRAHNGSRG